MSEKKLSITIVDNIPARAAILRQALQDNGFDVISHLENAIGLLKHVADSQPDIIIIDLESPDRDMLEHMSILNQHIPKPVIMFAEQGDNETITQAIKAGVSAYVVDGMNPQRVKPIVDVAVARFREFQALRSELEETQNAMADKTLINEAKQLLIKNKNISEDEAYHAIRKLAMNQGKRMVDIARDVISIMSIK